MIRYHGIITLLAIVILRGNGQYYGFGGLITCTILLFCDVLTFPLMTTLGEKLHVKFFLMENNKIL